MCKLTQRWRGKLKVLISFPFKSWCTKAIFTVKGQIINVSQPVGQLVLSECPVCNLGEILFCSLSFVRGLVSVLSAILLSVCLFLRYDLNRRSKLSSILWFSHLVCLYWDNSYAWILVRSHSLSFTTDHCDAVLVTNIMTASLLSCSNFQWPV